MYNILSRCENTDNACIIGTLDHMIANLEKLHNVRYLIRKPKINLPNGGVAYVIHIGNAYLSNGIELKEVLFIPEVQKNLLYVQILCEK